MIYFAIGMFAGVCAGLFGLGGGVIVVPALVMLYQWQGVEQDAIMHIAVSTSLVTIIATSLSSAYSHHRNNNIVWPVLLNLVPALMLGGFSGSFLAISFSSRILQCLFILFLVFAAVKIWLPSATAYSIALLNRTWLSAFGVLSGCLSTLVGAGGGTLIVPYLITAKQPIKKAIGTSSACGFFIAITAVAGFMLFGQEFQNQYGSLIDWKAFMGIATTSVVFARPGAELAKSLPVVILQRIFSILLLLIAIKMGVQIF